jgi:hypothetical protein
MGIRWRFGEIPEAEPVPDPPEPTLPSYPPGWMGGGGGSSGGGGRGGAGSEPAASGYCPTSTTYSSRAWDEMPVDAYGAAVFYYHYIKACRAYAAGIKGRTVYPYHNRTRSAGIATAPLPSKPASLSDPFNAMALGGKPPVARPTVVKAAAAHAQSPAIKAATASHATKARGPPATNKVAVQPKAATTGAAVRAQAQPGTKPSAAQPQPATKPGKPPAAPPRPQPRCTVGAGAGSPGARDVARKPSVARDASKKPPAAGPQVVSQSGRPKVSVKA